MPAKRKPRKTAARKPRKVKRRVLHSSIPDDLWAWRRTSATVNILDMRDGSMYRRQTHMRDGRIVGHSYTYISPRGRVTKLPAEGKYESWRDVVGRHFDRKR